MLWCTQSWRQRENVYCRCKTVAVSHSVMKWYLINTNTTEVSDVHKLYDEGEILIAVVNRSCRSLCHELSLLGLCQNCFLEDTLFWASDKEFFSVVTVNGRCWSPCHGYLLFTTQYLRWDQFTFGVLWMNSKIYYLIFSLSFYAKLIYWLNMLFYHHICCFLIVCNHVSCFIEYNLQLSKFLT